MKMADGMGRVAPPSPSPLPEAGIVERDRFAETDLNGVIRTSDQPISTFSADVDTASMGIVRRFIRDGAPPADAVQVEELVNYFDYNYPRPESAAKPFAPSVHLMPSPWGQGRELMVVGIRGWAPQRAKLPPANVVLLADVSGSMRGPDRLDLVKRSMAVLVDQLNGDDHVALVTYAGAAQLQPIADDVKFQVEFNPAQVAEYRLVGYETRMLREEDFANDAVDAGEIGDGHRVTAI
ncbi:MULTISPECIES: YfbK domain-containing protein [Thiorhodovibrio]|uniref:YfbK domain-containing protein n=1 Tax=Thiorhodovibrio TaxID=61593 RepID=UPI001912B42E|nr:MULTISPECIES: von Willebrand factor type A domain-containing protein [Thiorhodovibrio]